MKINVTIPRDMERKLYGHLFQGDLEQGAFLFAKIAEGDQEVCLEADSAYLVPPDGWEVQAENYLELKDTERAKIMKIARDNEYALVDCHSHPASNGEVWFSYSDRSGISDFAAYVKWKLDGRPYIAMVWGESSVDAIAWYGNIAAAVPIGEVRIVGDNPRVLIPRGTWQRRPQYSRKESTRWRPTGTLVRSSLSARRDKK